MKDFSNRYIVVFSVVMVAIVATVLSLVATLLKPAQDYNYEVEKKKSMLESIGVFSDREESAQLFEKYFSGSYTINGYGEIIEGVDPFDIDLGVELSKEKEDQHLPVFPAVSEEGEMLYVVPVEGTGLWGPIWGYIALRNDMNTVFGVTFDHEEETPGLGAEINTTGFEVQFMGKKLFEAGSFVSIKVLKAGAEASVDHSVDAISGGTITSRGVENMLKECLGKYEPYFLLEKDLQ